MADLILEGTTFPVTTSAAVRLVAGLDISEYPDDSFPQSGILEDLELDLNTKLDVAGLKYITIVGQGGTPGATPDARRDFLLLKKYAKYKLAQFILDGMGLGFAKELSDGQDSFKRFAKDQDEVRARMEEVADGAMEELLGLHGEVTEADSPLNGAGNVYDPVTGEGS
jgi:hypothetical protein